MSKEYLEALEHIYYGSQGYGETDKYYKYLKEYLESIDNANPSEALEWLNEQLSYTDDCWTTYERGMLQTIKQALLKAQEPKHYLKWEDLNFTRDEKVMLVKMGDTVYKVLYRCCDGIEEVQLLSEDEKLLILNLIGKYKDNIQVFYDLRLERVLE